MTGKEFLEISEKLTRGYEIFCSSYTGCHNGCPYRTVDNCKEAFIKDISDIDEYIESNKLDPVEI